MPDGSYNGPGSGAPTRNLIGTGIGVASNFVFPGLGLLTGPLSKLIMKGLQGPVGADPGQNTTAPGQQPAPGDVPSGGHLLSQGYTPTGNIPIGNEYYSGDFGRDLPSAMRGQGPGDYQPQGPGGGPGSFGIGNGSFFGGSGAPIVPGSGFLNNQSSLPTLGGGHSDYGADMALHSANFRNTIQGMGYNNLNQFLNQTGFRLPGQVGGGQGIGGGS